MRRLDPDSIIFTLLLGTLGTLPPFSIDMALPALSRIGASLNASVAQVTLTLSLFMAGFSIAQLAFGPISDRFGRKPTLLFGCVLFALASFVCAGAGSIEVLLAARFVEGCGAGAGMVMVFAIVRDLFAGTKGRTKLSYVTSVVNVAPMIAPTLGAALLVFAPWRAVYAVLGVGGSILVLWIALGLEEPLKERNPHALRIGHLLRNYLRVARHRSAAGYILINGLSFGCMFAYVSGSSFTMMNTLGLSPQAFALSFAATALGMLSGSFFSGWLSQRHVPTRLPLMTGLLMGFLGSGILLGLILNGNLSLVLVLPLLVAATFAYGLIAPNAAHGALLPLPEIAGVAGASLGCMQMAGGSLASAMVARFGDIGTAQAMAAVMTVCAGVSLLIYLFLVVPAERASSVVME